jgi:hypothetical protein
VFINHLQTISPRRWRNQPVSFWASVATSEELNKSMLTPSRLLANAALALVLGFIYPVAPSISQEQPSSLDSAASQLVGAWTDLCRDCFHHLVIRSSGPATVEIEYVQNSPWAASTRQTYRGRVLGVGRGSLALIELASLQADSLGRDVFGGSKYIIATYRPPSSDDDKMPYPSLSMCAIYDELFARAIANGRLKGAVDRTAPRPVVSITDTAGAIEAFLTETRPPTLLYRIPCAGLRGWWSIPASR